MGLCYRCLRFLSFCANQLQKGLLGYTRKVWIAIKTMVSSRDHGYCIWQKRCYGQCKNKDKQKFDILSIAFDKFRSYIFDNYIYYCAYQRSEKRTQTKKRQYFSIYICHS